MRFCTIAAGAGMLAAVTFAATSSAPAQSAGAKPSTSTHTRAAKPQHRAAKPQREARARRAKQTRLARQRRQQPAEPAADTIGRPTAPAPAESPTTRPQGSAERRFREFLNPQSFVDTATEQLRSPRLAAAHFSSEITGPALDLESTTGTVAVAPRVGPAPIVAHDQTTSDETPSKTPVIAHSDPVEVQQAAPEKAPDRMSFLRWFFVAWGGALTFASAVRMAVG
jgi:hypothetical protein